MCEMSSVSPTINSQSSSHSLSSSSLSTTLLITPTTQPSDSFLVGGIIVGVVCIILVCTCLLITACIIVCVKKRSKSNPEELSTSLNAAINDNNDANVNTLKDNPAYATSTGSLALQDNPAYASTSNTVPVDASNNNSNSYSTTMNPNQVNNHIN
ncbi:PREDICTED: uncharacterized protein LOC109591273 [Amphimedon queenslandica]|uniref:Uncharacterized protein n=1 Tax=Amphimedon queenslandica TaxID=400682 RepID=A0AAN0K012_AMPQE|nr:PREDICTED: uncharacterized protein LOC109591273 [Amphimedon queenslandica]|eukprot:XP_019862594.1 PREDICTED: uncharacterized protein LOC109591273 [Amphimedon queenslandica]